MPTSRAHRRFAALAAGVAALAAAAGGTIPAYAADSSAGTGTGTATAIAGKVDLDVQLLPGILGALRLPGLGGIDVPLANLELGEASAPNANGDSANFTNSTVRVRDDLIEKLHLSGPEADLLKADVVSGTARVIKGPGGYAQAYATVGNLRVFLPLVTLPGASADNGILKIDAVSAQATCQPGQKPSVSAKLPTTILFLGKQYPVPLSGDVPVALPGVATLDVHLSPVTSTAAGGASAAVEAQIAIDAVGLAKVSGGITLASAACTMPSAAAVGGGATSAGGATSSSPAGATGGSVITVTTAGAATATTAAKAVTSGGSPAAADADNALAATGASSSLLPIAGTAVVLVLGGAGLLFFLKRKAAGAPPQDPGD
ncbi:MAG: LPXTG cell wall anchor domain-containing protein [Catenulispora sp.]